MQRELEKLAAVGFVTIKQVGNQKHYQANRAMPLGRTINSTFYSTTEWIRKQKEQNNFVVKIIKQQKIFLIGNEDELNRIK